MYGIMHACSHTTIINIIVVMGMGINVVVWVLLLLIIANFLVLTANILC